MDGRFTRRAVGIMAKKKKQHYVLEYLISLSIAIAIYLFFTLIVNVEEKYFIIPLSINVHPDYIIMDDTIPRSVEITVRGNPASLNRIAEDNITAFVDFSVINTEGEIDARISVQRLGVLAQMDNVEVYVLPKNINTRVEKKVEKVVRIIPSFINSLPRGYTLKDYYVLPQSIKVQGPRSLIEELTSVDTTTIELDSITKDVSISKQIKTPHPLISIIGNQNAKVRVAVEQSVFVRNFKVIPEPVGINKQLKVDITLSFVNISLQGFSDSLDTYAPKVFFDLSPYQLPGVYTVDFYTQDQKGIELISIEPSTVTVALKRIEAKDNTNER